MTTSASSTKIPIKIGIIGGTGLNNPELFQNRKEITVRTPYGKTSDVLVTGTIKDVQCILLARHGRNHAVMPGRINYRANIWALENQGCIIATTATSSLQEHIKPGDFIIIDNFIDNTSRKQTFYDDKPESRKGMCHMIMEPAFCERTRNIIIKTAKELGFKCHEKGTIVTIEGPRYSNRLESLMYQKMGGDILNMTTVPEVVLAKEAGILYGSIALVIDYDSWKSDQETDQKNVLCKFQLNLRKILQLLLAVIPNIATEDWTDTITDLRNDVRNCIKID